ncbi:MAG: helix-turn-helix domain-containing protein [Mobilitalea sp.]
MDCNNVGKLIFSLRKEKGMTQKQLADVMNISDKTISKWERGLGCPDVSLLQELSEILGINVERILAGKLEPNRADIGNMKKIKFYVCPVCNNVVTATGEAKVSCCGRKLLALVAKKADEEHRLNIEIIEDEFYITFDHEMSKSHYISFIAYVDCDRILLIKLYPEQSGEIRFPRMNGRKFYFYCNRHELWVNG